MQEVRREYEDIVAQLQPFTEESVSWPSRVGLCYPQFQPSPSQCDQCSLLAAETTEMGSQVCGGGASPSSEAAVRGKTEESTAALLDNATRCSTEHTSVCQDELSCLAPNEEVVVEDEDNGSLVSDQSLAERGELAHTPDKYEGNSSPVSEEGLAQGDKLADTPHKHEVLPLTYDEEDASGLTPEEENASGSGCSKLKVAVSDELQRLSLGVDEDAVQSEQHQCSTSISHHDTASGQEKRMDNDVFKTLHTDRASLLELRSKLGMELMWLKQAIASRQKV